MNFDPAKFLLRQDFELIGGSERVVNVIPVRKPGKTEFFRLDPSPASRLDRVGILQVGEKNEDYLVAPDLVPTVQLEVKLKELRVAVNYEGHPFVWLVPAPDP